MRLHIPPPEHQLYNTGCRVPPFATCPRYRIVGFLSQMPKSDLHVQAICCGARGELVLCVLRMNVVHHAGRWWVSWEAGQNSAIMCAVRLTRQTHLMLDSHHQARSIFFGQVRHRLYDGHERCLDFVEGGMHPLYCLLLCISLSRVKFACLAKT